LVKFDQKRVVLGVRAQTVASTGEGRDLKVSSLGKLDFVFGLCRWPTYFVAYLHDKEAGFRDVEIDDFV